MKKKKINYIFILIIITALLIIAYVLSRPILRSDSIRTFKKQLKEEFEYVDKIKFEYSLLGLYITIHSNELSEGEAEHILDSVQAFISTQEFTSFLKDKLQKEYQELTETIQIPLINWPIVNVKIYKNDNLLPSYQYNAGIPWTDWNKVD